MIHESWLIARLLTADDKRKTISLIPREHLAGNLHSNSQIVPNCMTNNRRRYKHPNISSIPKKHLQENLQSKSPHHNVCQSMNSNYDMLFIAFHTLPH